jgi:hypothetical protein
MSVDYTRKHQWKITPKGSRYRKTYIDLHRNMQRSHQRERFQKGILVAYRQGDTPTGGAILLTRIG